MICNDDRRLVERNILRIVNAERHAGNMMRNLGDPLQKAMKFLLAVKISFDKQRPDIQQTTSRHKT